MRKVNKRMLGTGLAIALSMTKCMNVFAAKSPQKDSVVSQVVDAKDKDGKSVDIIVRNIPDEYKEVAKQMKDPTTMKEVVKKVLQAIKEEATDVKEEVKESAKVLKGIPEKDLLLIDVRDVVIKGDASLVKFPVEITFEVPGVLETSKVAVFHYVDGAWQLESSKAGKGTITATFDSLSPVAFVVDKNTVASSTTAPQTGVEHILPIVAAIVGFGAVCVLVIKRRESTI